MTFTNVSDEADTYPPTLYRPSQDNASLQTEETLLDDTASRMLLPIPTNVNDGTSALFMYPNAVNDRELMILDPLPEELANFEISIAHDGTYVETSSGSVAMELKKRYDHIFGVGRDVRSPYAITSLVNQHGRLTYRIGHRASTAPGAQAEEVAESSLSTQSPPPEERHGRAKRKSRMSVHALPQMFKGRAPGQSASLSGPRKLRKTRSFTDEGRSQSRSNVPPARTHSKSITNADLSAFASYPLHESSESLIQSRDIFANIMGGEVGMTSSVGHSSHSLLQRGDSESIDRSEHAFASHPFGSGTTFEPPSQRTGIEVLRGHRLLREMQSFESGLTARQTENDEGRASSSHSDSTVGQHQLTRPASAIKLRPDPVSPPGLAESPLVEEDEQDEGQSLDPETLMHSRYSTDIFDVLQTYRGIPLLEKVAETDSTVIKISLSSSEANRNAPRDDPRFVIWGTLQAMDRDDMSDTQDSATDLSASVISPPASAKARGKRSRGRPSDVPSFSSAATSDERRVILAATIERWIGQLTSDLDYDELLAFLLTYRTYIGPVDLCHLLICRFHWALQKAKSQDDERVRQVVRLRTFVALRYWLQTFFEIDFVPNRELRIILASWLNALIKDSVVKSRSDALNLVTRLRKVVKDCKLSHLKAPMTSPSNSKGTTPGKQSGSNLFGKQFAEATKNDATEDSDIDLDFNPEESLSGSSMSVSEAQGGGNLTLLSPTGGPMTLSSLSAIRRSDISGPSSLPTPFLQPSDSLPLHHGALSRAFVKTVGRLGRWKRVLNNRSSARTPVGSCTDLSAFDVDANGNEELNQYMKTMATQSQTAAHSNRLASTAVRPYQNTVEPTSSVDNGDVSYFPLQPVPPFADTDSSSVSERDNEEEASGRASIASVDSTSSITSGSPSSTHTSSTDSLGQPIANIPTFESPYQFDVVSIDDLDLSDSSSNDGHDGPPGLRRPTRKLPLRRDFEFVPRPESVSTMSVGSHSSDILPENSDVQLGQGVAEWQLSALVESLSDDEEVGDVEAALRRLEGQINPTRRKEKALKVDGWVRVMRERVANGDFGEDLPNSSDEDVQSAYEDGSEDDSQSDSGRSGLGVDIPSSRKTFDEDGHYGTPTVSSGPFSGSMLPSQAKEAKPPPEPAIPAEILESRLTDPESSRSPSVSLPVWKQIPEISKHHRSYILGYRAEILAQHFAMIDKELFLGLKFEELILDDWRNCDEIDVLDWSQYLKDRESWRATKMWPEKRSALAVVRARFNVMANFTISEIVLSQPNERAHVVAKFLRIAWKSYCLHSYNNVVAIMAGLTHPLVERAMSKSWGRIPVWETRIFKDFKEWVRSNSCFKHVRTAVEGIVEAKPLDTNTHSVLSGGNDKEPLPTACVPFIGVYLSQIHHYNKLPDLIDPTAPNKIINIDLETSNFDSISHPEVFSTLAPLPPSMSLEPLINVHKQRLIAGVAQSLVQGQHSAKRVQFPLDKRLYQRCSRLQAVGKDTLQRILQNSTPA